MKRFLTIFLAVTLFLTMTVTAYADDTFTPKTYKTAQGTATVDGVKDEAYEKSDMFVVDKGGLDRELLEGHATAKVWTLWDYDYLYVYAEVNDTTPCPEPNPTDDKAWEIESVEIYVDYEDNKSLMNPIAQSFEACQLRICRYPDSFPDITGVGANRVAFVEGMTYKVVDNKENGYIVEAAIKHSETSFTGKMGFSLQINDDANGDKVRDNVVYVDALQKDAWQYTDLLDTIEFEGFVAPEKPSVSSEEASSEDEVDSVDEVSSTDEIDSVDEVSSEEPSLGLTSSTTDTPMREATLDPVISIIVFVVAAAAIIGIILLATKKK